MRHEHAERNTQWNSGARGLGTRRHTTTTPPPFIVRTGKVKNKILLVFSQRVLTYLWFLAVLGCGYAQGDKFVSACVRMRG